jgi:CRP/FNR family transcriptional regulator, cyclic AMP receptor protein
MLQPQSIGLKTGLRPVQENIKSFKAGEIVFEEGTTGRELFIVQEGVVGVYKTTSEGQVELARIDKGGIIGEMSLLDRMPRSATVKSLEPTKVLVINEMTFQAALKSVPVWLTSIIKIVVSRLRDANKRVDQAILRDKELGIASLMLLLLPGNKHEFSSQMAMDYDLILLEAFFISRLKKKETIKILSVFEKKNIISIVEDSEHKKHICFGDLETLHLFEEYLSLKSQKKTFKELSIPEEAIAILSNIVYVSQKEGIETAEGTTLLKSVLLKDIESKNRDHLEKSLLDLKRRNLLEIIPIDSGDATLIFEKEVLRRIKKIKEWVPRFEQEIS